MCHGVTGCVVHSTIDWTFKLHLRPFAGPPTPHLREAVTNLKEAKLLSAELALRTLGGAAAAQVYVPRRPSLAGLRRSHSRDRPQIAAAAAAAAAIGWGAPGEGGYRPQVQWADPRLNK